MSPSTGGADATGRLRQVGALAAVVCATALFAVLLEFLTPYGRILHFAWTQPPSVTITPELEAMPFVTDVRSGVSATPGGASRASRVTLSPHVEVAPREVANGLAGVSRQYVLSSWSIEGKPSTAEVSLVSPVAPQPIRWWTDAVAKLAQADGAAALHCRITDHAMRCEVDTDDPATALEALSTVDGSQIGPWLDSVRDEEGEDSGFTLLLDGITYGDATTIS